MRCVLQVVIEPFAHSDGVVFHVFRHAQIVVLAFVFEQDYRLVQTAEGIEVGDALGLIDGAVFVVGKNDQRSLDVLGVIDGRVADVGFHIVPIAAGETALAVFEDRLVCAARVAVDQAIHAYHVGKGRARDGGVEDIGLSN